MKKGSKKSYKKRTYKTSFSLSWLNKRLVEKWCFGTRSDRINALLDMFRKEEK